LNQLLAAGKLAGFHFNCVTTKKKRILPPGGLPIIVRSVAGLELTGHNGDDYSDFLSLAQNLFRMGGWILLVDAQLDDLLHNSGLSLLLREVERASSANSLHPKFRLLLLSSNVRSQKNQILYQIQNQNQNQKRSSVRERVARRQQQSFSSNDCRISIDADHHSLCNSLLGHYMNGHCYTPSNDRKIRKLFFAATYFHAVLCSTFSAVAAAAAAAAATSRSSKEQEEEEEVVVNKEVEENVENDNNVQCCPYGQSDFQFMLYMLEQLLVGASNIRAEDVSSIFRTTLELTYATNPSTIEHFQECLRNVFGEDDALTWWPLNVSEKVSGNRVAALEYARGL